MHSTSNNGINSDSFEYVKDNKRYAVYTVDKEIDAVYELDEEGVETQTMTYPELLIETWLDEFYYDPGEGPSNTDDFMDEYYKLLW